MTVQYLSGRGGGGGEASDCGEAGVQGMSNVRD